MSRIHSCVLPVAHCVSELPEIVLRKKDYSVHCNFLSYISVLGITGYKDKWRRWYHYVVNGLYFRFVGSLFL